jgi:hypothetical protein
MLKRMFGPKWDKVTGECRKLHNKELHNRYSSPTIVLVIKSRRIRGAGHVAWMRRGEAYTGVWWGYLGRSSCRWEDNIKMDL